MRKHTHSTLLLAALFAICAFPLIAQSPVPDSNPITRIEELRNTSLVASMAITAIFLALSVYWSFLPLMLPFLSRSRSFDYRQRNEKDEKDSYESVASELLHDYHRQALRELERSVGIGNSISLLGIAIIFVGVVLAFFDVVTMGVVSMASGLVIQIINALFHKERDKCRERVAKIEDAIFRLELAKAIRDPQARDEAIAKVIESYSKPKQLQPAKASMMIPASRKRKIELQEE